MRLILLIVVLNVVCDLYATYLAEQDKSTAFIYNILNPIEQSFAVLILSTTYPQQSISILLKSIGVLLPISAIINIVFFQGFEKYNGYTLITGGLVVAIISYIKTREYITIDKINLNNELLWFTIASFIYYITTGPVLSVIPVTNEISYSLSDNLLYINDVAYILWSTLITIGFICSRKKTI